MKKALILFTIITSVVGWAQKVQQTYPDLEYFITLNADSNLRIDEWIINEPRDKDLANKLLVINMWKSDCQLCDIGLKEIELLQKEFDNTNVYFINLANEESAKVLSYFTAHDLETNLMVATDKRKVSKLRSDGLKEITYPLSVVIDKGKIVYITRPSAIFKRQIQQMIDGKWQPFDAFHRIH